MKIGFIGAGNMASAIIKGIIKADLYNTGEIGASSLSCEAFDKLVEETGICRCASNAVVALNAEIVILAVKPNIVHKVLEEIRPQLAVKRPLLISIAAGTPISKLEQLCEKGQPIARVMPNVNALIGQSASAVCANQEVSAKHKEKTIQIFEAIGKVWELPEKDFSIFAAIAGCSPAYAFLFIDAISRAAVKNGLPKDLATEIAAQAVLGSSAMVGEAKDSPWNLIDKVCSPGGTTIAGLTALEDRAFMSTVMAAIQAATDKDEELQTS